MVPRPERLAGLRSDYRGMGAMFFEPPLPFDTMMKKIAELEGRINSPAG